MKVKIPIDKLLHIFAGAIIGQTAFFFIYHLTHLIPAAAITTILSGALAGIAKEIYDTYHHGTVETADALFTAFGAILGAILFSFITLLPTF